MKKFINYPVCCIVLIPLLAANIFAQVTVSGYVRTMTGLPIQGATVTLVTLNQTAITNDSGFYDFAITNVNHFTDNTNYSFYSKGKQLLLNLEQPEKVSITIFNLSGQLVHRVINRYLPSGKHTIALDASQYMGQQLYLAKTQVGSGTAWYKMTLIQGNFIGLSDAQSGTLEHLPKSRSVDAEDSLVVTHPEYHGGIYLLNTRKISSTTGTQHFRMFSSDTSDNGWYAPPMKFNFTPHHQGVDYYKDKVPDYVATEQEVHREVFQIIYRYPSEIPSNKKYNIYNCNINGNVSTSVASTGGNTLNFNPGYINGKSWYEIIGVQFHECVHSYQPYYSTTGANGFGEAIPDAIRALCGFFKWPKGTKCRGGYQGAYQTGGKYWYFIELKHPGFIHEIYKLKDDHIEDRVEKVTGVSLDDLCKECETEGMPFTHGR